MSLVFVHGVATRDSPQYRVAVAQRDALFRRLVIGNDEVVFNPDWGDHAVSFAKGGWVPDPDAGEAFGLGAPAVAGAGPSIAATVASRSKTDVDIGVDLALASMLERDVERGKPPSDDQLLVFEAAVRYLEERADEGAFTPAETDTQFAETLRAELKPLLPAGSAEPMGLGDVFSSIGDALKAVTDRVRNAGSDAVLRFARKPLSNQVALFLGDIFFYLRWRETDSANGTYSRIFEPIIAALSQANSVRQEGQRLIVVGHSLGAVILYDLLTDDRALAEVKNRSGKALSVDALVSVGAQPGLFADMGLYARRPGADGRLLKPGCVERWMNVYDVTDVLSFRTEPFFSGVKDYQFDNVAGALEAHSAYFQRPSFYKRLRARLSEP